MPFARSRKKADDRTPLHQAGHQGPRKGQGRVLPVSGNASLLHEARRPVFYRAFLFPRARRQVQRSGRGENPGAPFYRDVEDCRLARIAFPDRKETAPPSAFPVTGRWGKNRGPFPPEGARNALPEQELFYKEQKEPFFRLSLFFRASGQNAAPCLTRLPKFFPTFFKFLLPQFSEACMLFLNLKRLMSARFACSLNTVQLLFQAQVCEMCVCEICNL